MKNLLIALFLALFCAVFTFTQNITAQTSGKDNQSKKGGIVFKIPDDVFPMDWNKSGFKGILMLRKDSPSGIFIAYPNDDEKIEDLRERTAKFIAPMFIRDENEKKEVKFQKSPIPVHKGDLENSGLYYSYENEGSMTQILFYEREANGKKLIYGYFASKNKETKAKSVKEVWADEKGQGVKIFEKFWRTFQE